jgi:hypothetical protein
MCNIEELRADPRLLDAATKEVSQHWKESNQRGTTKMETPEPVTQAPLA